MLHFGFLCRTCSKRGVCMTRNFGLKKREAVKGLRCEWQYKRDCRGRVKAALIIAITLIALIAVYAFIGSQDAKAGVEAEKAVVVVKFAKVDSMLAHCLNGGTFKVNEKDAIKCGLPIYEKGN